MLSSLALVLGLAVVGGVGAGVASAAQNNAVVISNATLTTAGDIQLEVGSTATFTADWDASSATPQEHQTFTVTLPEELQFSATVSFPLKGMASDSTEQTWANCVTNNPSSGIVTCTFTAAVATYNNVHGTMEFEVKAAKATSQETVGFDLNGATQSVDLPGTGGIDDGLGLANDFDKEGALKGNKWSMGWTVKLGGNKLQGLDSVTLNENLTAVSPAAGVHKLCTPSNLKVVAQLGSASTDITTAVGAQIVPSDDAHFTIEFDKPAGGFDTKTVYVITYDTCTVGETIDPTGTKYSNTATVTGLTGSLGPVGIEQTWTLATPAKSGTVRDGADRYGKIDWTVEIPGVNIEGSAAVTFSDTIPAGEDQALCMSSGSYTVAPTVEKWYGPSQNNGALTSSEVTVTPSLVGEKGFTLTITPVSPFQFETYPYVYKIKYQTCITTAGVPAGETEFTNSFTVNNDTTYTGKATVPASIDEKAGVINSSTVTFADTTFMPQTTLDWSVTVPGIKLATATDPWTVTDTLSESQTVCEIDGKDVKTRLNLKVTAKDQVKNGTLPTADLTSSVTAGYDPSTHVITLSIPTPTLAAPGGGTTSAFSKEYQYVISYTTCTSSGGMDLKGTTYGNIAAFLSESYTESVTQNYQAGGTGTGVTAGSFTVTKKVEGDGAAAATGKTFTVHVREFENQAKYDTGTPTLKYDRTIDFTSGGPNEVNGLYARGPAWIIELSEPTLPDLGDAAVYGTPQFTSANGGVSINEGRTVATFSPVPGTNVAITLTNFLYKTYAVGDYVWADTDRNGIQGDRSTEPPVAGALVSLFGPDGTSPVTDVKNNPVEPVPTNADGFYMFDNLPAGCYTVKFSLENATAVLDTSPGPVDVSNYVFTRQDAGTQPEDDVVDSDANSRGLTTTFCLGTGDEPRAMTPWDEYTPVGSEGPRGTATEGIDPTWDAGIHVRPTPPPTTEEAKSYAVGDYTWIDSNGNGVQDAGEPVLPGVTVQLLNASGSVIKSTVTDSQGRYLFDELAAGTYQIRFTLSSTQAAKYQFTKANQGNDEADSDANQAIGLTVKFVLGDSNTALSTSYITQPFTASEGIDPTWDAGVIEKKPSVSVGDYVWFDKNGDGRQDPGEPGIKGVTMCLVGPNGKPVVDVFGNPVTPVKTDSNGKYLFENLPVLGNGGTYIACIDRDASETVLKDYAPTKEGVGNRAKDSSTWTSSTVKGDLTKDGQQDLTLDFGFELLPARSSTVTAPPTTVTVAGDGGVEQCTDRVERGFEPGETVTITVTRGDGSTYQLTAKANKKGVVGFCLDVDPGETVTIEVQGENQTLVREITVDAEDAIAYTGVPVWSLVTGAMLLLAAGGALVLGTRRRQGDHS